MEAKAKLSIYLFRFTAIDGHDILFKFNVNRKFDFIVIAM